MTAPNQPGYGLDYPQRMRLTDAVMVHLNGLPIHDVSFRFDKNGDALAMVFPCQPGRKDLQVERDGELVYFLAREPFDWERPDDEEQFSAVGESLASRIRDQYERIL